MQTIRQSIEIFHLLFLDQLSKNLDKSLYAIKGGCNLRFFFQSIRYSEDLDIDIRTVNVDTLKNKIDKILKSAGMKTILKSRKLTITQISTPKQTETTQRWKILLTDGSGLRLNTKIEFSRRIFDDGVQFTPINAMLIHDYKLMPIICPHYDGKKAIKQKIEALAGRAQTQARDVFDLYFLISLQGILPEQSTINDEQLKTAELNIMNISFSDYKSQVVAYLADEYQNQYGDEVFWNQMLEKVLNHLEAIK